MILTLVMLPTPEQQISSEEQRTLLETTAPAYQTIPGLQRKYFIADSDNVGGVYEWDTHTAAEAYFSDEWYALMTARYGSKPIVRHFAAPCVVDNQCAVSAIKFT